MPTAGCTERLCHDGSWTLTFRPCSEVREREPEELDLDSDHPLADTEEWLNSLGGRWPKIQASPRGAVCALALDGSLSCRNRLQRREVLDFAMGDGPKVLTATGLTWAWSSEWVGLDGGFSEVGASGQVACGLAGADLSCAQQPSAADHLVLLEDEPVPFVGFDVVDGVACGFDEDGEISCLEVSPTADFEGNAPAGQGFVEARGAAGTFCAHHELGELVCWGEPETRATVSSPLRDVVSFDAVGSTLCVRWGPESPVLDCWIGVERQEVETTLVGDVRLAVIQDLGVIAYSDARRQLIAF